MISYHKQDIKFDFSGKRKINKWIRQVVYKETNGAIIVGNIAFIFCSDRYMLDINSKYLNHKHHTDVITFNYNENNIINGDVFIGLNTVQENSKIFNVDFSNELKRVIIHSVLHLLDYNDSTQEEKSIMKSKEDFYLNFFDTLFYEI